MTDQLDTVKVYNMTPHSVDIVTADFACATPTISYPATGNVLRLDSRPQQQIATINRCVPLYECQSFTQLIMNEDALKDVVSTAVNTTIAIIVSMPVGQWLAKRCNGESLSSPKNILVVGPDTGSGALRNKHGQIIGTTRLEHYATISPLGLCILCNNFVAPYSLEKAARVQDDDSCELV